MQPVERTARMAENRPGAFREIRIRTHGSRRQTVVGLQPGAQRH